MSISGHHSHYDGLETVTYCLNFQLYKMEDYLANEFQFADFFFARHEEEGFVAHEDFVFVDKSRFSRHFNEIVRTEVGKDRVFKAKLLVHDFTIYSKKVRKSAIIEQAPSSSVIPTAGAP